jgi:hypothetical protein
MRFAPLACLLLTAASAPDYGPAPDRATGIALVEQAVRSTLKDPDSAKFTWPNGFVSGWYHPFMDHKYVGWITCGTVNAKNSYGGYVGSAAVVGVIHDGQVVKVDIDDPSSMNQMIADGCAKMGVPVSR